MLTSETILSSDCGGFGRKSFGIIYRLMGDDCGKNVDRFGTVS